MPANISISGVDKLDKAFAELEPKIQKKILRQATRESAKTVLADAKRYAPYDEGGLQRSLSVRAAKGRRGGRLPRGTVGHAVQTNSTKFPEQFYGGFLELGTQHIEPREFIREALYANQKHVRSRFSKKLRNGLRKIAAESR